MQTYRNVAISKTKHGVVCFAIIEEDSNNVVALAKSNHGIYQVHFVENYPTEQRQVLEYLHQNKTYFENF